MEEVHLVKKETFIFIDWVNEELRQRGWTASELASRGGLAPGSLNNVLSGSRNAGPSLCRGIARGLSLPEELVFRKAGLLSPLTASDQSLTELVEMAQRLTPDQRRDVIYYMSFLIYRNHKPESPD